MEEKKNIVLNEILDELNNVLSESIDADKTSSEYKVLSQKKNNLDIEIEELMKLNDDNIGAFLTETESIKEKYPKLNLLDEEKICILSDIYNEYYKGLNEYKNIVKTRSFLSKSYDDEINKNDFENIKSSEEFDRILEKLEENFSKFMNSKDMFLKSTKNFNKYKYKRLLDQIKDGSILDKETLNGFRGMGTDNLIDKMFNIMDELNYKVSNIKKPNERIQITNEYECKLEFYLKELVRLIEDYVKKTYLIYEDNLGFNLDYKDDFLSFYNNLLSEMEEKENFYKISRRDIKLLKSLREINESKFIKALSTVGIDSNKLSENEKKDIFNVSIEELNNLIVKIKLFNRFSKLNENKEDDVISLNM